MQRIFIIPILISALLFSDPLEASRGFESADAVDDWLVHYYQTHDTAAVVPAIRAMFKYGFFDKDSSVPPMIASLSTIFDLNEDKLEKWLTELGDLSLREKEFLWIAIDLSNNPRGQKLLNKIKDEETSDEGKKFIEDLLSSRADDILEMEIREASVLDMLWGRFFSSGDERCIRRIITALPWYEQKDDMNKALICGAAGWSLESNAARHKLVMDICIEELKNQPENTKKILQEIIEKAQNPEWSIEDCLTESVGENGEKNYTFNIEPYDYLLGLVAVHARSYPPQFENEQQREEVEGNLKSLIGMLEVVMENNPNDIELLLRQGFAHSMGHNLDFEGSAEKASAVFEKLLAISPDHPRGNYLYGMFLIDTATGQKESIKYLKKAYELGVDDALYTLGLAYASQGEKEKGLECLEKYQKLNPDSELTKTMINAIKNEKIQFHQSY